jgi:hypothetical protein
MFIIMCVRLRGAKEQIAATNRNSSVLANWSVERQGEAPFPSRLSAHLQ